MINVRFNIFKGTTFQQRFVKTLNNLVQRCIYSLGQVVYKSEKNCLTKLIHTAEQATLKGYLQNFQRHTRFDAQFSDIGKKSGQIHSSSVFKRNMLKRDEKYLNCC